MRRRKKTSGDKPPTGDWVSGDGSPQDDENTAHRHGSEPPPPAASGWERGDTEAVAEAEGREWLNSYCGAKISIQGGGFSVCGNRQFKTPTGLSCPAGHDDAPEANASLDNIDEKAREFDKRPDVPFEVREGDRLSVNYNAAKLQIVPFSSVELDGGFYSRTLVPGDDPVAEWDRIYGYLRDQALKGAREKLATFADELAKAKKRAGG